MQEVKVSLEVSDGKRNRGMPKKRASRHQREIISEAFITSTGGSFFFSWLLIGSAHACKVPKLSGSLHLLPEVARHKTDSKQKIVPLCTSNALSGKRDYFYWFKKTFCTTE